LMNLGQRDEPSALSSPHRVMLLLSTKGGMRAVEIASITWGMVTDAEGEIGDVIALQNRASKGRGGGRIIPIHPDLSARGSP